MTRYARMPIKPRLTPRETNYAPPTRYAPNISSHRCTTRTCGLVLDIVKLGKRDAERAHRQFLQGPRPGKKGVAVCDPNNLENIHCSAWKRSGYSMPMVPSQSLPCCRNRNEESRCIILFTLSIRQSHLVHTVHSAHATTRARTIVIVRYLWPDAIILRSSNNFNLNVQRVAAFFDGMSRFQVTLQGVREIQCLLRYSFQLGHTV
jgi:hypothetical protein